MAHHFVCVSLITLALVGISSACRPGWHSMGSKCYFASHDLEGWGSATAICNMFKAQLAEIHTAELGQFLFNISKAIPDNEIDGFWIGLNDVEQEGTWIWSKDMSTLTDKAYQNWAANQPDNGIHDENCMYLSATDGKWYDGHCGKLLYYICEQDSGSGGAVLVS